MKVRKRLLFEQIQPHARISPPIHPLSGLRLCSEHPAQLALPSPLCSPLPAAPTLFLGLPRSAWQGNPLPSLLFFLPRTNQTPLLCQDAPWDPGRGKDHAQIYEASRILQLNSWLMASDSNCEEAPELPLLPLMGLNPHFQWPPLL